MTAAWRARGGALPHWRAHQHGTRATSPLGYAWTYHALSHLRAPASLPLHLRALHHPAHTCARLALHLAFCAAHATARQAGRTRGGCDGYLRCAPHRHCMRRAPHYAHFTSHSPPQHTPHRTHNTRSTYGNAWRLPHAALPPMWAVKFSQLILYTTRAIAATCYRAHAISMAAWRRDFLPNRVDLHGVTDVAAQQHLAPQQRSTARHWPSSSPVIASPIDISSALATVFAPRRHQA